MPTMHFILDGWNTWHDLSHKPDDQIIEVMDPFEVAALAWGIPESRQTSVTFRLELPDGKTVLVTTSLAGFLKAARAFEIHYPNG